MIGSKAIVAELIRAQVSSRPNDIAYIFDDQEYSWKAVDELSNWAAITLRNMKVKQGDKVALWGINTLEWVICYFAIQKIGATAVLINSGYKDCEASYLLAHTNVSTLLLGEPKADMSYSDILTRIRPSLPELRQVEKMSQIIDEKQETLSEEERSWLDSRAKSIDETDVACIIFTSGTTSRPKGVQLAQQNLVHNAVAISDHMQWSRDDTQLLALPFFHGSGMVPGILCGVYSGMKTVILRSYKSIPALEAMQKYHCTIFTAVPSMLMIMMQNKKFDSYDLSSYRSGIVSGSSVLPEMYHKICKAMGADQLQMAYGQTETSPLITISPLDDSLNTKSVTVGKPIGGIPIRVWNNEEGRECAPNERGEIQVFGDTIMKGYYRQPELTAKKYTGDGWWKTDDVGFFDHDGYLHFCGRCDDMIVRGGENISPLEIEECICRYNEKITDIKVVGVPSIIVQEEIAVLLTTKDGYRVNPEGLQNYIKSKMASFKVPKYVFQLDTFPLTSNGKPDGKKLKAMATEMAKEVVKNGRCQL